MGNVLMTGAGLFGAGVNGKAVWHDIGDLLQGGRVSSTLSNLWYDDVAAVGVPAPRETVRIAGSDLRHINGALGEAHGWRGTLDAGHVGVKAPGKVTAPGVDFVTYNPQTRRVVLWDSKYRGPNGRYPTSIPQSKIHAWTAEARAAAEAMADGPLKRQILDAIDNGRIDAEIFRWPQ